MSEVIPEKPSCVICKADKISVTVHRVRPRLPIRKAVVSLLPIAPPNAIHFSLGKCFKFLPSDIHHSIKEHL